MRNLLSLLVLVLFFSSCSHFGQFTEPVEQLVSTWEETTETVEALAGKVTAEQTTLLELMDQIPQKTTSVFKFGENYLEQSDQLISKFMGHKSTFDELAESIQLFSKEWQDKGKLVTELQQQLTKEELPGNVLTQINELNTFLSEGKEKVTKWESEVGVVMEQCQKTRDDIVQLIK